MLECYLPMPLLFITFLILAVLLSFARFLFLFFYIYLLGFKNDLLFKGRTFSLRWESMIRLEEGRRGAQTVLETLVVILIP